MQVLASVPDLDIVAYLPLFLSSLMDCLTDPLMEVRSKAAKVLQVSSPPSALLASEHGRILLGGGGLAESSAKRLSSPWHCCGASLIMAQKA